MCGALGAARARASDEILPAVGIELLVTVGQTIERGQPWAKLHHESHPVASDHLIRLQNAVVINNQEDDNTYSASSRILEVIQ